MKLVAYPLAALLGLFGLLFVVGSQGQVMRLVVGAVLWVAAGALVWLALQRPKEMTTTVTPTRRDILLPHTTRLNMSLPNSSVPKGCSLLGGSNAPTRFSSKGS